MTDIWSFKVILIGPAAVGKTSLLKRFISNKFSENLAATLGVDYLNKELKFSPNSIARLTIWDIGGQERFKFLRNTFYRGANGALIVFDLTRAKTYKGIKDWVYEMRQLTEENIPFVLIGNKCDLFDDIGPVVDSEDAQRFAESEGNIYIETSAKTGENVEDAFIKLTHRMANREEIITPNVEEAFKAIDYEIEKLTEAPKILIDEKEEKEILPKNAIEAQGLLIKAFYEKFGNEALPIIKEVCKKQGRSLGLKIKKKLNDNRLSIVAKAFTKSYDPNDVKVISISDKKFQVQGTKCPFGLENTSRELCEAVMEIDHEYFRTAVSDKIELKIINNVAAGDSYCDTIYELKE